MTTVEFKGCGIACFLSDSYEFCVVCRQNVNGSEATIVGDAPAGGAAGGMEPDGVIEVRSYHVFPPQFRVLKIFSKLSPFVY
jgi:hypothetical protein